MSEPTAPAAKVGWVKKQGRSGLYKNWKKRYFVLKLGCISYYEEADKPETLKGDLHLAETEVKDEITKKSDNQIYIASFNGDASLLMEFDSQAEVEKWLISIKEHIAYANDLSTKKIKASDLRMSLSRFSVPTLKKGWLIKQGRGKVKSWKKRFFVLNNGTISYYEKDTPTFPFGDVLKGDLFLANSKVIVENLQKPNQIFIECSHDEKSLLVEVEASDDASSWVNSINSHILFANQSSADNTNVKKSVIKEYSRYTICASTLEEEGNNDNNNNTEVMSNDNKSSRIDSTTSSSSLTSKQQSMMTEDKSSNLESSSAPAAALSSSLSLSSTAKATTTAHATATTVTTSSASNTKSNSSLDDDDMLMDEEDVVTANKPFLDTSRSIMKKSERNNDQQEYDDVLSKALFAMGAVLIALQLLLGLVFKNVTSSFLLVGVLMIGSGFYLLKTKTSSPSTQQQQQQQSSSSSSSSAGQTGLTISKTIPSTATAAAAVAITSDMTRTTASHSDDQSTSSSVLGTSPYDNTTSTAASSFKATTTTALQHQQHQLVFEDDESDNDNDSDDSNFDGSTLPTIRQSVSMREDLLADINLSLTDDYHHSQQDQQDQYPRLDEDIRGIGTDRGNEYSNIGEQDRDSEDHYDPNNIRTMRTTFSF